MPHTSAEPQDDPKKTFLILLTYSPVTDFLELLHQIGLPNSRSNCHRLPEKNASGFLKNVSVFSVKRFGV